EAVKEATEALENLKQKYRSNKSVATEISKLTDKDATRDTHFKERLKRQKESLRLPVLPTTTIGRLPQTKEVQQTRSKWSRGDITNEAYETLVNNQILKWIDIHEVFKYIVFINC